MVAFRIRSRARRRGVLAGAMLLALLLAAPARGLDPVVVDCTSHNGLSGRYSVAQLRHALAVMPADAKEYTACPDIIQRQLDSQLSGLHARGGSDSGSGGSFLPGPVIAILVVVLLAGAAATAVALRRRGRAEGP